jgi:arylamine N-acetyltransferase
MTERDAEAVRSRRLSRRINYAGPHTPTYDTVAGILKAHVASVPLESFDVLLGRPIRLDPEGLHAKIIAARRGGYCFEHASLMYAALEARFRAGPALVPRRDL